MERLSVFGRAAMIQADRFEIAGVLSPDNPVARPAKGPGAAGQDRRAVITHPTAHHDTTPGRTANQKRSQQTTARKSSCVRMAQKVQTLLVDDLDGGEAEATVRFGLDGTDYEIDLNAKHAEALRKALAPYVNGARRASGGSQRRPGRSNRRASADGLNKTEIREWARSQGIEVKDRGQVPAELVVKFKAATGQ